MQEISVAELARWRASGKEFVLLDVRNDDEVALAALSGSVHIPMPLIPERAGELRREGEIAVLCHYGGRSERVTQFLAASGFSAVYNVLGGIDEYAARIDPTVPRY